MTEHEFETLFREQFNPLTNLACTVVKDTDEARDVVQQVFLNYWQRMDEIRFRSSVKGYFYKAVLNESINRFNKTRRFLPIEDVPAGWSCEEPAHEETAHKHHLLHKAIGDLPPVCQKVFRLSRFSDMTNKEIAEELNISVKAVEKHITKALKFLRERLKPLLANDFLIAFLMILAVCFLLNRVGYSIITLSL